jgi:hypothetical protein
MAITYSPKIATDGLVFYYDMVNTKKSFVGAPTTNLLTNPNSAINVNSTDVPSGVPVTGYSSYSTGYNVADWAVTSTAATGVTFSFSIYMRSPGGVSTYLFYAYTGTGPDGGWFSVGSGSLTNTWTRYTFTTSAFTGTLTTIRIYRFNSAGTIELAAPQVEVNSIATPFVVGTRSTTQAIIDLTSQNTITATSLTYAANNTFSFNGSGNYMDVTGAGFTSGMTSYTIMHWSQRNVESRMPVAGRTSTAFYHYGDNSWYYTHGGVSAEYYYPRVASIPLGTWGNYCIVYNGSNVAIYRNAYLEGTQSTTGTADWSQGMRIGYWTGGSGYQYSGNIGAVQFYNRALSAAEVQGNFNAHRGRYGI